MMGRGAAPCYAVVFMMRGVASPLELETDCPGVGPVYDGEDRSSAARILNLIVLVRYLD